ncbi:MAG: hypothetical protein U1E56_01185 [Bauldia sp.]
MKRSQWISGACICAYLGVLVVVAAYALVATWPVPNPAPAGSIPTWNRQWALFARPLEIDDGVRVIVIVMLSGIVGASIHAITSAIDYLGNAKLAVSWAPFYVMRPFVGMLLALIIYFAVRGGFLTPASGADVSPYGAAALGAFSGMFSKQATDKLREVFEAMFRTKAGRGDDGRKDKLDGSETNGTASG